VKPHRLDAHKKGSADFRQRGLGGITHSPGQPLSVRRSYSSGASLLFVTHQVADSEPDEVGLHEWSAYAPRIKSEARPQL
jgi:hypothetical protein